jgi:alanyl-tRNA synthetase
MQIEKIVNNAISKDMQVIRREMSLADAQALGAEMEFGAKYPDIVSVYFIEDENGTHFSKEFCGGPHVTHTGELGTFKIQKEEAVSQGVRRIKAILM